MEMVDAAPAEMPANQDGLGEVDQAPDPLPEPRLGEAQRAERRRQIAQRRAEERRRMCAKQPAWADRQDVEGEPRLLAVSIAQQLIRARRADGDRLHLDPGLAQPPHLALEERVRD